MKTSFRSAHRANIFCAKFLPSTDDLQVSILYFDYVNHASTLLHQVIRSSLNTLNTCHFVNLLLLSHSKTITYCSMTNSYILSVIGGSHETFNTIICAIMDAQCTQWQNVICCYKLRCELHTAWLTSHLLLCRDSILVISTVKVVKLYKNIQNVIFSSALESGMRKLQRTFRVKNSDLLNLTDWKQLHKLLNSLTICPK